MTDPHSNYHGAQRDAATGLGSRPHETVAAVHSLTWRDICATLIVARDAEMDGRTADAKALLDEVAPDCEWKRCSGKRYDVYRGWRPDTEDDYDYVYEDVEVDTPDVQRRAEVRRRRTIDWLAWQTSLPARSLDLATFESILKQHYSPDAVAQLAILGRLTRASGDAIEMRFRSYAMITRPGWNGVFTIPDD